MTGDGRARGRRARADRRGDLAEHELDEEALARIGLVRAYGALGDAERALAEADARRAVAAGRSSDHAARPQRSPGSGTASPSAADGQPGRGRGRRVRRAARARALGRPGPVRRARRGSGCSPRSSGGRPGRCRPSTSPTRVTGVANRRHLELRLPEMVSRARTRDEAVALAFVDLDVDTADRRAGDDRHHAAERRPARTAFVARYGGTEFVVVLPRRTARQLADVVDGVIGAPRGRRTPRPRVGVASAAAPAVGGRADGRRGRGAARRAPRRRRHPLASRPDDHVASGSASRR